MSNNIYSDNFFLNHYEVAQSKLKKVMSQLSTGDRIQKPGDETIDFERLSFLGVDRLQEIAGQRSLQMKMSWYQSSLEQLGKVQEILSSMSELAIRAKSDVSASERDLLNVGFQEFKEEISSMVDGFGGAKSPLSTFNGTPLFLGYAPEVDSDKVSTNLEGEEVSLYTGYQREALQTLSLITQSGVAKEQTVQATALSGSTTTLEMGDHRIAIDDVYKGMTIEIVSGSAVGESAIIDSYNAETGIVTFDAPLTTAVDNTSVYKINTGQENRFIEALPNQNTVSFSSLVWGADNDRTFAESKTFRALTKEEQNYRQLNSIPDSDLEAKTYEEKMIRREKNLFDQEFGVLLNRKRASQMFTTLQGAMEKVSQLMTKQGAKIAHLSSQYEMSQNLETIQENGMDLFQKVDPAEISSEYQKLAVDADKIMALAARMNENLFKLNELLRNEGVR